MEPEIDTPEMTAAKQAYAAYMLSDRSDEQRRLMIDAFGRAANKRYDRVMEALGFP